MALRTAILADGEQGLRTLARLSPAELGRVLHALDPGEARRILEGFADRPSPEAPASLLAHLEAAGWPALTSACPERLALALLVAVVADGSQAPPVTLVQALAWLRHSAALGADFVGPLARGDNSCLDSGAAARLLPLLAAPAPLRQQLVRLAVPEPTQTAPAAGLSRFTPFGGPLMLLRFLDELPLDPLGSWPTAAGAPAAVVVRALVLTQCAGGTNALAFLLDPVWRDLLSLPPALLPAVLAPWCRATDRTLLTAWHRALPPTPRPDRDTRSFLALPEGSARAARWTGCSGRPPVTCSTGSRRICRASPAQARPGWHVTSSPSPPESRPDLRACARCSGASRSMSRWR